MQSKRIVLIIPLDLLNYVDKQAKKYFKTRNGMIRDIIYFDRTLEESGDKLKK